MPQPCGWAILLADSRHLLWLYRQHTPRQNAPCPPAAQAAEDREDRHQQHPPLGQADATTHPPLRQRLVKLHQIASSSKRGGGLGGQDTKEVTALVSVGAANLRDLPEQTSNRHWGYWRSQVLAAHNISPMS